MFVVLCCVLLPLIYGEYFVCYLRAIGRLRPLEICLFETVYHSYSDKNGCDGGFIEQVDKCYERMAVSVVCFG
jgi:hypothetical protein